MRLADGRTLRKDLIVVADGVHVSEVRPVKGFSQLTHIFYQSRFVQTVIGLDSPAEPTGHSAFRFLIPTDKLYNADDFKFLFQNVPSGMNIAIFGDIRLVWYPCRSYISCNSNQFTSSNAGFSGELYNFVGIHPEMSGGESVEGECR